MAKGGDAVSVSDFDLAAALGLGRPLEPAQMVAMVAEQRGQRDAARHEVVFRFCANRGAVDTAKLRAYATERGWGYLYPEEPGPAKLDDCDACGEPMAESNTVSEFVVLGDETVTARVHHDCQGKL